jgi:hypothetical protein
VNETQEIIDNLVQAGFPEDDITVFDGKVYAGRDAEVTLAASREMLEPGNTTEEQYRTTNLVSKMLTKICINGSTFTGVFSTALDLAIQNYNELPLSFVMARTPSSGCGFTINASIDPNMNGGVAGFPSGGLPFGSITIGGLLSQYGVDTIEHVITHELGHTLGFRHSDYYNRAISCGSGGNEGDAGIGAIHIPGTPTTANVGGSVMNSCFRSVETGEFVSSDSTALRALYTPIAGSILGFAGKCLDADASTSGANGTRAQLWDCLGGANQQWRLLADGTIRGFGNKCLDADANASGANGTRVQLWDCLGGANQQWRLLADGTIQGFGGKCLDADASASGANGTRVQLWDCLGGVNQKWAVDPNGGAAFVSRLNNKCMDVPNGDFANGNQIQMYGCNGTSAQKWTFAGNTLRTGRKCLDVAGGATSNGTAIQLWDCNDTPAQNFTLTVTGELVSQLANKCVDIKDANASDGARLHLWDCVGVSNQKWDYR